jgi:hypothetical protein
LINSSKKAKYKIFNLLDHPEAFVQKYVRIGIIYQIAFFAGKNEVANT